CAARREETRPAASAVTLTSDAPPPTRREPVAETLHGETLQDPYRWLEDGKAPEVQAWVKAQNAFARERLARIPARGALAARLKSLLYVDSVSPPVVRGGRHFYLRTRATLEKAVLCWREGEQGEEKVLLDPNDWTSGDKVSLGIWVPSHDGKRLAFTVKPNAADEATLHVLDVEAGTWSEEDVIPGAKYATPQWTPDGAAFYYEWLPTDPAIPADARPGYAEIRFHRLGTDPASDPVIHPRTGDPATFLKSQLSRDGKYLFVSVLRGWSENDLYWMRPGKDREFRPLVKGKGARYEVTAWKDQFYLFTDEGAPRGRVFRASPNRPERTAWKELVPEDPMASLQGVEVLGGKLALLYLRHVASELRLASLDGRAPTQTLTLPRLGSVAEGLVGSEDQDTFYFNFSTLVLPRQVFRASATRGTLEVHAKVELPFDASPYVAEQLFFPSKDGARIPMFVVRRKDLVRDGKNPVLLTGYGGFNVSLTPDFRPSIVPWLEAGGVFAMANLRGGGEYGSRWHEAGRRDKKQHVFDDFISAAQLLIRGGVTRPERLAISGRSNGGLLVGAAVTQRPELFGAVICGVPLLDMVRYHKFGSGMTWTPEYGSADVADDYRFIRAYSPYQAVKEGTRYPPLLMMAADRDDRVDPMHARKFVAALQHADPVPPPGALLRVEAHAGHRGADRVKQAVEAGADEYAFLFDALGIVPSPAGP
ncbi:MAG TPA: prolyl oligopeptidase family serine peptidase, partial [Myxococcaceae bacterium]|nr:prolyl oligopeptidase family serine peptidase [Myxococcaceae bacterium]